MIALIEFFHWLERFILGDQVPIKEKKNDVAKKMIEEIPHKKKKPLLYIEPTYKDFRYYVFKNRPMGFGIIDIEVELPDHWKNGKRKIIHKYIQVDKGRDIYISKKKWTVLANREPLKGGHIGFHCTYAGGNLWNVSHGERWGNKGSIIEFKLIWKWNEFEIVKDSVDLRYMS